MKRKIYLLGLLLCACFIHAQEQEYKVLNVHQGDVVSHAIPLKQIDSLVFATDAAWEAPYTYVDLGIQTVWATCNIGAEKPEDYGDYYAWGEVYPKTVYTWDTYLHGLGEYSLLKYCNDKSYSYYGTADGIPWLYPADDVAQTKTNSLWNIPDVYYINQLMSECTWTWTTLNNVAGYQVTGPNGNSIFLPAAGYMSDDKLQQAGECGSYWAANLEAKNNTASCLSFSSEDKIASADKRCYGLPIRPVIPRYYIYIPDDIVGGKVIGGDGYYFKDSIATLTAVPDEGYKFVCWDDLNTDNPREIVMQYNLGIEPIFKYSAAVYFPTIDGGHLNVDETSLTTVRLERHDASQEQTVSLEILEGDANVFNVPQQVTFAAGDTWTQFAITYKNLGEGQTYKLVIKVDDASTQTSGNPIGTTYTQTITALQYEHGTGVFVDNALGGGAWYVDYKLANMPDETKKFVLLNPYTKDRVSTSPDEYGIYDGSPFASYKIADQDYNFVVSISAYDAYMDAAYMGIDIEYGTSSYIMAPIHLFIGGDEQPGIYTPNVSVIFPMQTLACQTNNGAYYAGWEFYFSKEAYLAAYSAQKAPRAAKAQRIEKQIQEVNSEVSTPQQMIRTYSAE